MSNIFSTLNAVPANRHPAFDDDTYFDDSTTFDDGIDVVVDHYFETIVSFYRGPFKD